MMIPHKILCMSDLPLGKTGYSNVTRELITRLSRQEKYDINVFAWNYGGMPVSVCPDNNTLYTSQKENSYKILPAGLTMFGQDMLHRHLKSVNPDLLWVLCDLFMIPYVAGLDLRNFIMYFPSDGRPLPSRSSIVLKKANYPVAMSKFAQKQAQDEVGIECDYIPHGINSANYGPIAEKDILRQKWSKRWKVDLKDKFLIGYVGRFQGRKMVSELLRAYAKFQKGKDDVFLILHCDPLDPAGTQDGKFSIIEVIKTLGIGRKVIFTGTHVNHGFELQEMCELYNLLDIHASATSGEGFGLTTLESMACGVPNVITDYTTSRELLDDGKCGLLTPVGAFMTGTFNVERAIVDIDAMAAQFEELYDDRSKIKMFSKHCLKKAQEYDWDNVVFPMWERKFKEVLE